MLTLMFMLVLMLMSQCKPAFINLNPNQLSPLNVFSQNVVAKYYVMFLCAKELKKRGF